MSSLTSWVMIRTKIRHCYGHYDKDAYIVTGDSARMFTVFVSQARVAEIKAELRLVAPVYERSLGKRIPCNTSASTNDQILLTKSMAMLQMPCANENGFSMTTQRRQQHERRMSVTTDGNNISMASRTMRDNKRKYHDAHGSCSKPRKDTGRKH